MKGDPDRSRYGSAAQPDLFRHLLGHFREGDPRRLPGAARQRRISPRDRLSLKPVAPELAPQDAHALRALAQASLRGARLVFERDSTRDGARREIYRWSISAYAPTQGAARRADDVRPIARLLLAYSRPGDLSSRRLREIGCALLLRLRDPLSALAVAPQADSPFSR